MKLMLGAESGLTVQPAAPALSVVMPARNVAPFVDAAIESILRQTFSDFELIIRDDGSTDDTVGKLRRWAAADSRIRLFEGKRQLGPAGSANWVVQRSRAPLIARMDADDIASPERLARQLTLLEQHPEVVLIGTLNRIIGPDGAPCREPEYWRVARRSGFAPFGHSSVMFRRLAFESAGGYRAACDCWEDLDFYVRMARVGRIAVLAEPLMTYRLSPQSHRSTANRHQIETAIGTMYRCLRLTERGHDYEAVLTDQNVGASRVEPMAFVALGSLWLWRGQRPSVLRRLLRRGRLGFDRTTFIVLAWAVCAAVSPALARRAIMSGIALKERAARGKVTPGEAYLWSPVLSKNAASPVPLSTSADGLVATSLSPATV